MALIQVRDIYWRRNSPYGGYSAGDIVSLYYNNVTETMVVKKNGVVITSGNSIPYSFQSNGQPASYYKTETGGNILEVDIVVCSGTTRKQFPRTIVTFPYVEIVNLSGNPSCAVSPTVCDLTIGSFPTVVNESSDGASDGSITVTATSSNGAIEYNLNADFIYGGGSSTGIFNGLTSGIYRIYARDAANCSDSISVAVNYDVSYGVKYFLEYDDLRGDASKIEIQERDYSGSSTEIKGGDTPILIRQRGEGEQNKFVPVLGCELEVTLASESKYQYQDLFTSDPNKYRIVFYKDFGSGYTQLATGKILPNQYKEVYNDPPYLVNFIATDGLAALKDVPFTDSSGGGFFGSYKSIQIIANCLKATGMDFGIKCAVNLYADGMTETASSDPLDQAYVDVESYYTDDTLSYLDVIVRILQPYGAQLTQWGGYWNIVRVEEKSSTYDYRVFDSSGVYVSNSSFDPTIISQETTTTGVIWVDTPEFEMNNAYGKISLSYGMGLRKNLIRNGDFKLKDVYNYFSNSFVPVIDFRGFQIIANGDDFISTYYQVVNEDKVLAGQNQGTLLPDKNNIALGLFGGTGKAYVISKPINIKLGFTDSLVFKIRCGIPTYDFKDFPYVKIRCVITYGSYYLSGDGRWLTAATEAVFFATNFGNYAEYTIKSAGYPSGADAGLNLQVKVYHAYAYAFDTSTVAAQRAIATGGTLVTAGSFAIGTLYKIKTLGTTDFTLIGATSNTVGLQFYATGIGSGTGTATAEPLGIGYRTQRIDSSVFKLYYYELEENTSAESVPNIVRPTDYNSVTNPVQWILKTTRDTSGGVSTFFLIDKISVEYLSDGSAPPENYEATINGEDNNPNVLKVDVKHGSLVEVVKTSSRVTPIFNIGFFFNPYTVNDSVETVVQNAEKTYFGYIRNSSGTGYTTWHRSYLSESLELHDILLSSFAAQYNAPWRRMRGALTGAEYVTPLNSIIEQNDNNKVYYPISLEIDDKMRIFSGEFVELSVVDDSQSSVGFTKGFSFGFNA